MLKSQPDAYSRLVRSTCMRRKVSLATAALAAALASSANVYGQAAPPATQPAPPVTGGSVTEQTPADLPKPYKPVAITPPATVSDPALSALRKKIADAAKRRDKAQLAKLVVGKGSFWDREGADDELCQLRLV